MKVLLEFFFEQVEDDSDEIMKYIMIEFLELWD